MDSKSSGEKTVSMDLHHERRFSIAADENALRVRGRRGEISNCKDAKSLAKLEEAGLAARIVLIGGFIGG